ncbi:hypothetical protein SAMN05216503_0226 [Polaribacter sp. KT25b]|uniref:hypothetical protein n=1 Tax=Polaribacter sp. KT25b TaxID=1855336 RepID=UPI00087C55D8|nr:hypothetical protein [Polaribacter sp. KT25b]SDR66993.1 hypothetical protein SAMN05216503_0226 [Polaribacter sp. KT25b]
MKPTIEQLTSAILSNKEFFQNIKLPVPQKYGTFYQCRSYAKFCATRIFNENFKDNKSEEVH